MKFSLGGLFLKTGEEGVGFLSFDVEWEVKGRELKEDFVNEFPIDIVRGCSGVLGAGLREGLEKLLFIIWFGDDGRGAFEDDV